ncbi:MAG: glycosyltransferase family 2 protein, partial [Alphaproteobacteria bacterium]|nr:glycosyltransferase family 2 protein [Alphaproteobacteria bacterium]
DQSFAQARAAIADPRITFVALGDNLGFAAGNNRAADGATAPFLATLNPDAEPAPDWLARLLAAADAHPDVAMFGSTQLDAADPTRFDGTGDRYFVLGLPWRGGHGRPAHALPTYGTTFSPCAAAALYRREGFAALGGFDQNFFCYIEDVDLAFRWRLRGGQVLQVGDAIVHHAGGASAAPSGFAAYHGMRNLIWAFVKNMPALLFWPLLPGHVALLALLLARGVLQGNGGAVARGLVHALVALPAVWRQRRAVQAARSVSAGEIAAALIWAPWKLRR